MKDWWKWDWMIGEEFGAATYNPLFRNMKILIFNGGSKLFNFLHSIHSINQIQKVNFSSLIDSIDFIHEIDGWKKRRYYNSKLSRREINHWRTNGGDDWLRRGIERRKNEINKQIQFFSLRMGRIDLCWWSGRSSRSEPNKRNEISLDGLALQALMGCGLLSPRSLSCGLWAVAPPMAPPRRREREERKQLSFNQ